MQKSYSARPSEIKKSWLLIDAKDVVLGRLAAEVAKILRGKNKPTFTPHMDCGDNVIIVNAREVKLTGNKADRKDGKVYYHHTGYPGGIKDTTAGKILEGRYPERVIEYAIKRMISKNNLRNKQMSNLYIYAGENHRHEAQQPVLYNLADKNVKNKR